ncbi:hypothetical protein [Comamonas serinivorans]|nr:hypothetical protein [Comamonas serinivorans]
MNQASLRSASSGGSAAAMPARRQRLAGWLLLALLCLMPLQFSWAAVARYCQHEAVAPAQQPHAGHHSHEHRAQVAGVVSSLPDADCHYCHASVAPFVISQYAQQAPSVPPQQRLQSPNPAFPGWIPPGIDRPNWPWTDRSGMAEA